MAFPSRLFIIFLGTVVFSVIGSGMSHLLKLTPGPVGPICGAVLVVSGSLLVMRELTGPLRYALLFFGAAVEIVGMYTGVIFGKYSYSTAWFPVLHLPGNEKFPLLVPFAWVFVAGGSYFTARYFLKNGWAIPVAGILATCLDAPMERAMTVTFGYWHWTNAAPPFGAPLQNAIGWFGVASAAAFLIAKNSKPDSKNLEVAIALGLFGIFTGYVGALDGYHMAWPTLAIVSILPLYSGIRQTFSR